MIGLPPGVTTTLAGSTARPRRADVVRRDRLAQLGHGRAAGRSGCQPSSRAALGGVADVGGRVEVGLADLEVDDVAPVASSARARAAASKAVSVPINCIREARRMLTLLGFGIAPTMLDRDQ